MNFTTNEIILLILIVSVVLIVFVVLTIIDIKDYLRSKKKRVIIEEEEEEVTNVLDYKVSKEETSKTLKPRVIDIDKEFETKYEINQKNVEIVEVKENKPILEESEIIFEEEDDFDPFYEEEEVVPVKDEITYKDALADFAVKEEVMKVEDKIKEEHNDLADTITNFEMEQEESAIISLDELMKVSDRLYEDNEPVQYDDGDEPITIDEVIQKYNNIKNDKEDISIVTASDVIRDNNSDMYVEEEEDFLTDLEIAHENLHR